MADADIPDYYELLQLSPRADPDTISRVFRHLAKRFHPDNPESGNADHFRRLLAAFEVLSDPERRAAYDLRYEQLREARWRVFDQATALDDIAADRRLRMALLSILYTARRNDAARPGLGEVELERLLQCPEEHMRFHVWYLKENGWVQRLDTGALAITAAGMDRLLEAGGPLRPGLQLLEPGEDGWPRAAGRAG